MNRIKRVKSSILILSEKVTLPKEHLVIPLRDKRLFVYSLSFPIIP
jgi:hypothetical protein